MMPARSRRSMADFLKEQQALEDPLADPAATAQAVAVIPAGPVPEPHSPAGHGRLTASEESDLAACEAAIDNLRQAFIAAGKALQVIRDGRLYRAAHPTFEDYVEARWDIGRQYAYRLIAAWPLGERLSPIGDSLTESHVRVLLPVAGQHGQDAAAVVYQAVAEADSVRVTAAVLKDVVGILPAGHFDPAEAVRQIRVYLAGETAGQPQLPSADPVQTFATETARLLKFMQRVAAGEIIRAARTADPEAVRRAVADIRAVLDQIEHEATT